MKRFLAIATVVALSGSLLVACGGSDVSTDGEANTEIATEDTSEDAADSEELTDSVELADDEEVTDDEVTDGEEVAEDVVVDSEEAEVVASVDFAGDDGNIYTVDTETGAITVTDADQTEIAVFEVQEDGTYSDGENTATVEPNDDGTAAITVNDGDAVTLTPVVEAE